MPAERQRTIIDILTRMSGGTQTRREADRTSKSIEGIGHAAHRVQGHVNTLSGALRTGLTGAAAVGFGAVAAGLVIGTRKGLAFNATIENSLARFGVFTRNAGQAKKLFSDIQTLNTKSTFGLGELAGATAYLGNAGLKVSKLPQTMEGLANAVAAAGGGNDELQRAAIALGQMAQNGVASREELNQLTEAGVSVGFLRKELGLSAKEYKDLGEQGIASNKVIDILIKNWTSGKIGKAAQAQAKTFSGQLSNLGDQVDQVLGAMSKPLFDLLKDDVFPQLIEWGGKFVDIFDPRFDFADNLKLALDLFSTDIVPTVVDELGKLVDEAKAAGLDKQFGDLIASGIEASSPKIGAALASVIGIALPAAFDMYIGALKDDPKRIAALSGLVAMLSIGPATFGALVGAGSTAMPGNKNKNPAGTALDLFGDRGTKFNPFYVIEIDAPMKKVPPVVATPGGAPKGGGWKGKVRGGVRGTILGAIATEGALYATQHVPGISDAYDYLGKHGPLNMTSRELLRPPANKTIMDRQMQAFNINQDALRSANRPGTPQSNLINGIGAFSPLIQTSVQIDGREIANVLHKEIRKKEATR